MWGPSSASGLRIFRSLAMFNEHIDEETLLNYIETTNVFIRHQARELQASLLVADIVYLAFRVRAKKPKLVRTFLGASNDATLAHFVRQSMAINMTSFQPNNISIKPHGPTKWFPFARNLLDTLPNPPSRSILSIKCGSSLFKREGRRLFLRFYLPFPLSD